MCGNLVSSVDGNHKFNHSDRGVEGISEHLFIERPSKSNRKSSSYEVKILSETFINIKGGSEVSDLKEMLN